MDHATRRPPPLDAGDADDAVARNEPARIRAKEDRIAGVRRSSRKTAPAATATAGLT
ncbi:hypothetical protein [Streptomyces sp. VNUA24]|uniref:hypothetical protein n=1 Tax=Streptomyces sp. VNUA24 TaxID=3031131 RepID=UPI0023B78DF4|nr:hypothetical protein [Streptomyces sp. VNUA24]WEH18401.1 hypothetical protein PYR72_33905 [Streptomyces sp. VNUA24]